MSNVVAQLQLTRRYLTSVLLNLDLDANDMQLSTFISILDHLSEHPEEYLELINDKSNN